MSDSDETVTLGDGSEVDKELFEGLRESLKEDHEDGFLETRFSRRQSDDPVTPFTAEPSPTVRNVAEKEHQDRSERAQHVDEEYNAPLAPDYETWAENKNRYDLAGVDTIPQSERDRRGREAAQRAQDAGLVDEIQRQPMQPEGRRGEFEAETEDGDPALASQDEFERVVKAEEDLDDEYPVFQEGPVLAHETGHAIDFAVGGMGEKFGSEFDFFEGRDADLEAEAVTLTERLRGSIAPAREGYRKDNRELVADAFAAMAIEPRAARREAPNLVEALETEFVEYVDEDDQLPF